MPIADDAVSLEIPCDVHAPRAVRKTLAAIYDGRWVLEDALLVASELVTNAVRHSGCGGDHRLNVDISRHHGNLIISVHDPALTHEVAEPAETAASDPGGEDFRSSSGCRCVAELNDRWIPGLGRTSRRRLVGPT